VGAPSPRTFIDDTLEPFNRALPPLPPSRWRTDLFWREESLQRERGARSEPYCAFWRRVHIEDDTKIEAAANFTIVKEDHTM
jgi:hypothetical protein